MDPKFGGDTLDVESMLPHWLMDIETQAVIIAGLCCVGAWVILQWIIQIMFSVLWPFFVVIAVMICCPTWRQIVASDYIPTHLKTLRSMSQRLTTGLNSTYNC